MRRELRNNRSPAFTLVELLVVIAIMSLLIAILLPSLRHARQQGRRAVCQSNLRSLAHAWQMHLDERETRGWFPRFDNAHWLYGGQQGAGDPAFGALPQFPVARLLNPYLGLDLVIGRFAGPSAGTNRISGRGAEPFRCPNDEGGYEVTRPYVQYYGTSYQMNQYVVGSPAIYPAGDPCAPFIQEMVGRNQRLTQTKVTGDPARLILIADGGFWDTWQYWIPCRDSHVSEWHGKSGYHNVAFLDGHVAFTRIRKGVHVSGDYTICPYRDIGEQLGNLQHEVICDD